ncbi:NTP/NDP exchange transporter [Nannocystaceae bacterium ST9]
MLLHRVADLRPGEGPRVVLAGLWCGLLLTANYGLHPLRDAMGVAGGVDRLHWLFTATFLAMLAAVPLFGLAVAKLGRARLVPWVHRFLAVNALVFFAAMQGWFGEGPAIELWTARVFFVWTSVFNLFAVSLFWSVMADLFAASEAKRLFGLISVGGSIGALLGPFVGGALALWADPSLLLIVVALALEASLICLRALHAGGELATAQTPSPDEAIGGSPFAGIAELLRSPALLSICAYVLLLTMSSTVVYFVQAQIVEREFVDDDTRTAVFASIDFTVNALTLAIQALLAGRLIRRFGLGVSLAVLPLVTLIGLLGLALAPVLAILVGMQVIRRACQYGIAKPAREVLFTAVDRSERYKAKSLIDTVVYRGGDALTGWAFAGLTALGLGLAGIALVFAPLAAGWIAVALWLGRERQ